MQRIIVTGAAGFIGFHLAQSLLKDGCQVIGIDNINSYYDPQIKHRRLEILRQYPKFQFHKQDIVNFDKLSEIFHREKPHVICHLAAQAGVRHSLTHPEDYIQSNLIGFFNLIELAKQHQCENFLYASSSSVYGNNTKIPFAVEDTVDHPISLYAATKKSNELIAHTYSHLYGLPTTGFRFFTVYGPWGRPDMALFLFTEAILKNHPIKVYNFGNMRRDFTFIDDIIQGIKAAIPKKFPYEIFNLGNHQSISLTYFIELIEKALGKTAVKELLPMQPGDVPESMADIDHSRNLLGFNPQTSIEIGIASFILWYRDYFKV